MSKTFNISNQELGKVKYSKIEKLKVGKILGFDD